MGALVSLPSLDALPSLQQGNSGFFSPQTPSIFYSPATEQDNSPQVTPSTTVTPAQASTATQSNAGGVAGNSWLFNLFSGLGSDNNPLQGAKNGLENVIFILLGLMLIAAGIFAFKTTQTIITTAVKKGKDAGAIIASAS